MSHAERHGDRDLTYSTWHREDSLCRYVEYSSAREVSQIDVDVVLWCEYDDTSKEPLVLIETARYNGQEFKTATVTQKLAQKADLPALTVLYDVDPSETNPACDKLPECDRWPDIKAFYVRRLFHPLAGPGKGFQRFSPKEYALRLLRLREWSRRYSAAEKAKKRSAL